MCPPSSTTPVQQRGPVTSATPRSSQGTPSPATSGSRRPTRLMQRVVDSLRPPASWATDCAKQLRQSTKPMTKPVHEAVYRWPGLTFPKHSSLLSILYDYPDCPVTARPPPLRSSQPDLLAVNLPIVLLIESTHLYVRAPFNELSHHLNSAHRFDTRVSPSRLP